MNTNRLTLAFATTLAACAVLSGLMLSGCGGKKDKNKYQPRAAYSGTPAQMPEVPTVPKKSSKSDGVYTVSGAIHDMRSRIHSQEVVNKEITIQGYIVKTNLADAPKCAVHRKGKKDGPECEKTPPPFPTFWICDDPGGKAENCIQVMGWASNWARVFEAIKEYKLPAKKKPMDDDILGVPIPRPIPAAGAKVKVIGTYSTMFLKSTRGTESNPKTGIITYKSMEYVEPPKEEAKLEGKLTIHNTALVEKRTRSLFRYISG
jgi:hypothetical protein